MPSTKSNEEEVFSCLSDSIILRFLSINDSKSSTLEAKALEYKAGFSIIKLIHESTLNLLFFDKNLSAELSLSTV